MSCIPSRSASSRRAPEETATSRRIVEIFKKADTNGDGFLSRAQLVKVLSTLMSRTAKRAKTLNAAEIEKVLEVADLNGDGVIQYEEFFEWVLYGDLEGLKSRQRTAVGKTLASGTEVAENRTQNVAGSAKPGRAMSGTNKSSAEYRLAHRHTAATGIQRVARGNIARNRVAVQKRKTLEFLAAKPVLPYEQVTTVAELWDMLTFGNNWHLRSSVEVEEIAHLFLDCRASGLDLRLATEVPMHFTERVEPEDLSAGEVAHICTMLIKNMDVSEEEIRAELAPLKADLRKRTDARWGSERSRVTNLDEEIGFKKFRKLVGHISNFMRIDEVYVASHMAFHYTKVFELPVTLAALIRHRCLKEDIDELYGRVPVVAEHGQVPEPDHSILDRVLTISEFLRLAYKCSLIDPNGCEGMTYADITDLFLTVNRDMPKLLNKRAERAHRWKKARKAVSCEQGVISGHAAFTVLIEALAATPPMTAVFKSPLNFAVALAQRADVNTFVEDDIAEALREAEILHAQHMPCA